MINYRTLIYQSIKYLQMHKQMLPKKVMSIQPCYTFMRKITQNLVDIIGDVSRIFSIFVTE